MPTKNLAIDRESGASMLDNDEVVTWLYPILAYQQETQAPAATRMSMDDQHGYYTQIERTHRRQMRLLFEHVALECRSASDDLISHVPSAYWRETLTGLSQSTWLWRLVARNPAGTGGVGASMGAGHTPPVQ